MWRCVLRWANGQMAVGPMQAWQYWVNIALPVEKRGQMGIVHLCAQRDALVGVCCGVYLCEARDALVCAVIYNLCALGDALVCVLSYTLRDALCVCVLWCVSVCTQGCLGMCAVIYICVYWGMPYVCVLCRAGASTRFTSSSTSTSICN